MTTTNCGDTCGLIDFTMAVAGDRLLPEERMKLAIEAVTSQKMSQRGAAAKYGVVRRTLARQLEEAAQMRHPTKTQSTAEVSTEPVTDTRPEKLKKDEIRSRLRALLRQHGAPRGIGGGNGVSPPQARGWLEFAGIPIPPELQGNSTPFNPSNESHEPTKTQRLSPNTAIPAQEWDGDPDPASPIYADELDIDAVRDHVCAEVQRSNRPADFKRAIKLLRELDIICTDAWYRRQPEPWGHDDWAHVSSEIEALHSIVGQRAEETADELLRKSSAVNVRAAAVR